MIWIAFSAQYYTVIGLRTDEEKPTSINNCPTDVNIITLVTNITTYRTCLFVTINIFNITTFRMPPTIENYQPFFLYRISRYYYSLIGTVITMIAGYIISLFVEDDKKNFRTDLVSPLVHCLIPKEKKIIHNNLEYCSIDKALAVVTYYSGKEKQTEATANA